MTAAKYVFWERKKEKEDENLTPFGKEEVCDCLATSAKSIHYLTSSSRYCLIESDANNASWFLFPVSVSFGNYGPSLQNTVFLGTNIQSTKISFIVWI